MPSNNHKLTKISRTRLTEAKHIAEHIKAFYNYFQPWEVWSMRYKQKENPHLTRVKNFEEFILAIKKYNNSKEQCCVYCGVNPYKKWRLNENVTHLKNIFMDVDSSSQEEFDEVVAHAEELGFKWEWDIKSGRGKYLMIPVTPTEINDDNRSDIYNLAASVIDYFNEKFKALDARCKDVSRISRVWGSIHYKNVIEHNGPALQCEIINRKVVSDTDLANNLVIAKKLAGERKQKYTLFNDTTVGECYLCDNILINPLPPTKKDGESSTGFNDIMGKNLAIYAFRKFGKAGLIRVQACYESRDKNPKEANGWFRKAEGDPDFRLNCAEIQNYMKKHYPDMHRAQCQRCIREKRNRIVYTDEPASLNELKNKYKKRLKFFIANRENFSGIVTPTEQGDIKHLFVVGAVYPKKNAKNFQEVLNMDDMENFGSDYEMLYIGEPEPDTKKKKEVLRYEKAGFYRYDFREGDHKYIMLSERKVEFGENNICGMIIEVNGRTEIAKKTFLKDTNQLLFVHDFKPRLKRLRNDKELFEMVNFTEQDLIDTIYTKIDCGKRVVFKQPRFINNLVLVWLFAGSKNYPVHINIIGSPHCGKTELLERLSEMFGENIVDCGGSTIKHLIPSFHSSKPDIGAFFRSRRVCLLDELVNMLARTGKNSEESSEVFITANNIIEHKRNHTFGSGKGEIRMSMKARIMSANNPISGKTIEETFNILPESFMDRFFPVRFTQNYKLYVNSNKYISKDPNFKPVKKFVIQSITDYLEGFTCEYNEEQLHDIIAQTKSLIPAVVTRFFESRTSSHHIPLLLDGFVKLRCLLEKDSSWTAKPCDYARLRDWLQEWAKWWWDDKLPNSNNAVRTLSAEQQAIVELVGKGISKQTLNKRLEERNIENKYNLKFLYDNKILANDGNNKVYPLVDLTERAMGMDEVIEL